MRTAILIVMLCLTVSALAEQSNFRSKLTSLLNMQSKAADAIDSALQLLRDLKQANIDAQAAADEVNRTTEAELGKQIADLLSIADANKQAGNDATTYRKHVENEIQVTQEYLAWINNRRQDIHRKREELRRQRCISNMIFIKALKEHEEALKVIAWLKEDVLGVIQGTTEGSSLAQIKDSAERLKAYAHLFNEKAMNDFAQLTQAQAVDASTAEWNAAADDNSREGLQVDRMTAGTDERNVGQKLIDAIDRLYQHLQDSIADLEKNEIRAAWDLAQWLQDSEAELVHLDEEQAAKTTYIDKMLIAIIGAKAHEDKSWEIYFESAATYNNAVADLEQRRAFYMEEKARRDEENAVLDDVIKMFIERVTSLDSGMRTKLETGEDLARRTDDAYAKDFGNLAGNVAAEAAAL